MQRLTSGFRNVFLEWKCSQSVWNDQPTKDFALCNNLLYFSEKIQLSQLMCHVCVTVSSLVVYLQCLRFP